jgi:hypothetical protein
VDFVELDQFDQWRNVVVSSIQQEQSSNFDALILDVGTMIGNDLHLTALSLANEFLKLIALKNEESSKNEEGNSIRMPRVVLIKSKSLSSLARRLVHTQRLLDGTKSLPSILERSQHPYIIASVGVEEYRRTIPHVVREGDELLEVGCHFGRTTSILHHAAAQTTMPSEDKDSGGFCIGVDIGPKIIQNAQKQYPDIPFAVCDAWRTLELLKLKKKLSSSSLGYDIVYADIGGLSGPDGLLESLALLDALGYALEPRCIVIKSLCMNRLASQLRAFSDVWAKINNNEEV